MKYTLFSLFFLISCTNVQITGPTVTNTNSNDNQVSIDVHDLVNFAPVNNPSTPIPSPTGGTETPLGIPTGSKQIVQNYTNANNFQLLHSCVATYGEAGWAYLDGVINTLKAKDPRWGYTVKYDGTISHDVIAYRATSDNSGIWAVDIIVDYCGSPSFGWGELGFDPNAQWSAARF